MKSIYLLCFLLLSPLFLQANDDADVLQCPADTAATLATGFPIVSDFTVCGIDNAYKPKETDYYKKYVESTSGGALPFSANLLNPLDDDSSQSFLAGPSFFRENSGTGNSGFYCGVLTDKDGNERQNVRAVLSKIDLKSGKYQCRYEDRQTGKALINCNYTNKACGADVSNVKNGFRAVKTRTHVAEYNIFPSYYSEDTTKFAGLYIKDYYKNSNPYGNDIQALNYYDLGKKIDELADENFLDIYGIAEYYGLNDTTSELNGGNKFKWNISGILTGLVTLDKNYFDGVAQNGDIKLKKPFLDGYAANGNIASAVNSSSGVYSHLLANSTQVGTDGVNYEMKRAFGGGGGNEQLIGLQSFVSQFDLKLWGFWLTINSNITKAYAKINQFAFGIAAIWLIGVLGAQKLIKSFNKTGDNTDYGMKLFGLATSLIVFFAPISQDTNLTLSNTNTSTPSSQKGLPSATANLNSDATFSSEYKERMTIFKYMIIHFAQVGNEFATTTSNAVVVSYADYLTRRQNIFQSRAELGRDLKKSYLHVLNAQKNYIFYRDICIPMYQNGFNQRKTFLLSQKDLQTYMTNQIVNGDWDGVGTSSLDSMGSFSLMSGVQAIEPVVCRNMEKVYKKETLSALESFHDIAHKALSTDRDVGIGTELVVHNMFIMQGFLGWINAATMPVSYFLLKEANLFADSDTSPSLSDRISNAEELADGKQTDFSESDKTSTSWKSIGDSMNDSVGKAFSLPLQASVFFMAPGFSELQGFFKEMLYNIFAKTEKGKFKASSTLTAKGAKNLIEKLIGKMSPLSAGVTFTIDALTSKPMLFAAATLLAMVMYMFVVNVIFMSLISMLILVRIILYFIDLLKYVFVSPFVVVWSATVNRSYEKTAAFIGQGAVLTIYPTLIVLSATIFLFAYELMQMLSGMLIGSLISQLRTQLSIINSSSTEAQGAFLDYLKIYTLEQSLQLTMLLISLFIAYKIIYEGPTWFLALFGYKEGDTHGGQMIREVSEKANRTSNPVI